MLNLLTSVSIHKHKKKYRQSVSYHLYSLGLNYLPVTSMIISKLLPIVQLSSLFHHLRANKGRNCLKFWGTKLVSDSLVYRVDYLEVLKLTGL